MHKVKVRVGCIMGMDIHMNVLVQSQPDFQKREPAISPFLEMQIVLPLISIKERPWSIITHGDY